MAEEDNVKKIYNAMRELCKDEMVTDVIMALAMALGTLVANVAKDKDDAEKGVAALNSSMLGYVRDQVAKRPTVQ